MSTSASHAADHHGHDHHHKNEAVEDIGDVGIDGLIGAPAVQRVDESRADQARYPGAYDIDGDGAEQGEGELDSICRYPSGGGGEYFLGCGEIFLSGGCNGVCWHDG